MPKPWSETVEARRRSVHQAVLDATAALVTELGLGAVTMSRIAERSGIGPATLGKYFADVDAVIQAWHDRQIGSHLDYLADIGHQPGDPAERLEAVLRAYAVITHQTHPHHDTERGALLHQEERLVQAQHKLRHLIGDLLVEGVKTGDIRDDVAPEELADYCVHALAAASGLPSAAAVRRLVMVTLTGLRNR